jgi:two-component system, OmpR family, phosphate regulon sensor histidine kinase PhoR
MLIGTVGFAISRWITRPIDDIRAGAERFAAGDLSGRIPVPESAEIGALAESLNSLARQLGEKIRDVEKQRNAQAAVLGSMVEGVLAVDQDERIININSAAGQLLHLSLVEARGRNLREVIRNPALQQFVARALASESPVEDDVVLHDDGETYVQAHGTRLRDEKSRGIGALIVLNDVSRLRRLENVRRDFVANVSHELKTPITSIQGFVETLQDGAVDKPEEARRFLGIIAKQSDRLSTIIEDLLQLSRIEQDSERGQIALETGALRGVLSAAVQACQIKADGKTVAIDLACDPALTAIINPTLLEQAVVNLLDNAIKYSEPGKSIRLEADASKGEIRISVQDRGCGIEREHLPRLFERFYRVDKARSRQLGGTGLGLAIVKHIVQAHQGRVTVDSTPGQGSTFTIHLPA